MAGNYEDRRGPPKVNEVTSTTVTVAAITPAQLVGNPSKAGGYYTFENVGTTDIHIVFGTTSAELTATPPTATTNAGLIKAGTSVDWYISGTIEFWSALAITSSSTLRYWRS